jgi:hypothetical protein
VHHTTPRRSEATPSARVQPLRRGGGSHVTNTAPVRPQPSQTRRRRHGDTHLDQRNAEVCALADNIRSNTLEAVPDDGTLATIHCSTCAATQHRELRLSTTSPSGSRDTVGGAAAGSATHLCTTSARGPSQQRPQRRSQERCGSERDQCQPSCSPKYCAGQESRRCEPSSTRRPTTA